MRHGAMFNNPPAYYEVPITVRIIKQLLAQESEERINTCANQPRHRLTPRERSGISVHDLFIHSRKGTRPALTSVYQTLVSSFPYKRSAQSSRQDKLKRQLLVGVRVSIGSMTRLRFNGN